MSIGLERSHESERLNRGGNGRTGGNGKLNKNANEKLGSLNENVHGAASNAGAVNDAEADALAMVSL